MKRTVKLIAIDKRYKGDANYPYRCIYDEGINTYKTGQHIDPNDTDTKDNLTVDEMTGKTQLSAEKRKRFPHVINPLHQINFFNNQTFDLTKDKDGSFLNFKDAAMVNLLRKYGWMVALSKDVVVPRKHYYYIKDEVFEAESRVSKSDKTYQAQRFIREEVAEEGLRDIGLVLNYKVKSFDFDPETTTDLILKDRIIALCDTNPDAVLSCKDRGTKDDIFVLKLSLHGLITRRGTDFYDGSKFISKDLEGVKKFMAMEENTSLVSKWNRILAEKEGRLELPTDKPEAEQEKEKFYDKLKDKSLTDLRKVAGGRRYPKEEWQEFEDEASMINYLISKV